MFNDRCRLKAQSRSTLNVQLSTCGVLLAFFLAAALHAGDALPPAQYAPDRRIDLRHIALEITPDFEACAFSGEATLTFRPIATPLDELRLDAMDLDVGAVTSSAQIAAHQNTGKQIVVTFPKPLPPDQEVTLTIRYSAHPEEKGLVFRTPANGYPKTDIHLWTQGESIDSRYWFPCPDAPNMKCTSEITCRVPEGMTVLSNGKQVSSQKDPATGRVAVRWAQEKPHSIYLITLVAGYFNIREEMWRDVPLRYYVAPSEAAQSALFFAPTRPVMEFFEREIGVNYPWGQYSQVAVGEFHFGGMENTSLTTLTDRYFFTPADEQICSGAWLIAHEMAHQWFGDLVTCKDWSHVWLNEGFATYYQHLFATVMGGRDEFLCQMYADAQTVLAQAPTRPMVFRRFGHPVEQFDYRAYPKGGWVLHMLRSQLGEELYRRCVKTFLERFQYKNATTEDFNAVIEELSGRSFDPFFDQWVYHAGAPDLDVSYSWDEPKKRARVSVHQKQPINEQVFCFRFPLRLRFKFAEADGRLTSEDRCVQVSEKDQDFELPLPKAPALVRIDPDVELLAKINFDTPPPMLPVQLADATDVVGRMLAAEKLATKNDAATIALLKQSLNTDGCIHVRNKAAAGLRQIHTDAALDALIASLSQNDARVRNAVVTEIAAFFQPRALESLATVIGSERNPHVLQSALRGLGAFHDETVRELLLRQLKAPSYRNRIADAAIAAMRAQDDPAFVAPLREMLSGSEAAFTAQGFADALETLGFLARNAQARDDVREFLAGYLNHKRERIALGATRALGSLEDSRAISILEKFASAGKENPRQQAAERAIAALRASVRPPDLKAVHEQLLKLQNDLRKQAQEIEALKKPR